MRLTRLRLRWLAVVALVGLAAGGIFAAPTAALADDNGTSYPTWDQIQAAQSNETTKAAEITTVTNLINQLSTNYIAAQANAATLLSDYNNALTVYSAGLTKYQSLKEQAAAAETAAAASKQKAGALVAQMYRSNGADVSLQILLSGGSEAQDLLYKLSALGEITNTNYEIYQAAINDANLVASTASDAEAAANALAGLEADARAKYDAAAQAQTAVSAALQEQQANQTTLYAQLASLQGTTAELVSERQEGIQKEQEAAAAAAAAQQQAAAAAAANSVSSGGGSGGSTASTPSTSSSGWVNPASGYISQGYGVTSYSSFHNGIDIAASCGTAIYAAYSGTVVFSGVEPYGAQDIVIQHDGVATEYAHMLVGHRFVSTGQTVTAGQHIGDVGMTGNATGCHLHFSVYITSNWTMSMMGTHYNTTDPDEFLAERGVSAGS